jgi:hypothetical protein
VLKCTPFRHAPPLPPHAPTTGVPDHTALLWHFRGRVAALRVERRALSSHAAKLRHAHLSHVASRSLPPHLAAPHQPPGRPQCDHVGPPHAGGRCACDAELSLADQAMAANRLAEADAAERAARLAAQEKCGVEDGDWWALLHHVVSAGPGGRLHQRLLDRLSVLPLSHHHRFPLYEQLAGAAKARDRAMHEAGLRVPPRFVASPEESEALLADLAASFEDEEGEVVAGDVGAGGGGGGGGGSRGLTPRGGGGGGGTSGAGGGVSVSGSGGGGGGGGGGDAPSGTAGSGDAGGDPLSMRPPQHRAAYAARKVLPLVLARHALRTPGATVPYDLHAPIGPTLRKVRFVTAWGFLIPVVIPDSCHDS